MVTRSRDSRHTNNSECFRSNWSHAHDQRMRIWSQAKPSQQSSRNDFLQAPTITRPTWMFFTWQSIHSTSSQSNSYDGTTIITCLSQVHNVPNSRNEVVHTNSKFRHEKEQNYVLLIQVRRTKNYVAFSNLNDNTIRSGENVKQRRRY